MESKETWGLVAPAWERYADDIERTVGPAQAWMMERLRPKPGETLLDLGAGAGHSTVALAEAVGDEGRVICTDFSPEMLTAARRNLEGRGLLNVEVREMDAQEIDLDDDSVDGVLFRFGLMLVPDPAAVCAGVHRVLRSSGRFALSVWGPPERNPWLSVIGMAMTGQGVDMGGNPFEPGGVFSLADGEALRGMLVNAGFSDIEVETVPGVVEFESFDTYWEVQTSLGGSTAAAIADMDEEMRTAVKTAARELGEPFVSEAGAVSLPGEAVGAFAGKS
jgi:SAM-dependent methyltransferase